MLSFDTLCVAQNVTKDLVWPAGTNIFQVGDRENNEIMFQLNHYNPGREVIKNNDHFSSDYIRVFIGNQSKVGEQYKNLRNVEIYRNDKLWIKTIHMRLDANKDSKRKIIFVADRYVLPKNTHKIKLLSTDAQGNKHDFKVKMTNNIPGKNTVDLTKRFRFKKIRWKKKIPLYKTIAYAKEEDFADVIKTIKGGIALINSRDFVLGKDVFSDFYGRCIINKKDNYITGYNIKINNKRISSKELTLVNATLSEKLQYLDFTHRVLLTSVSCPFDYNQQTRMEVTLTCTTNQNKTFVDKRNIYLPFTNFPVGPSGCDYDLPPFSYTTDKDTNR